MISIDCHENFNPWMDKSDLITEYKCSDFDDVPSFDSLNFLFGSSSEQSDADEIYPIDLGIDLNDLELEKSSYDFSKLGLISPMKSNGLNLLDDYFSNLNQPVCAKIPEVLSLGEKQYAPLSPDSGIEQDGLNSSFDECADVFSLMEQDKDVEGACEPVKLSTDSDIDKFLDDILMVNVDKNCDTDDEIFKSGAFTANLSEIMGNGYNSRCAWDKIDSLNQKLTPDYINGFERSRNDSISSDLWLNEATFNTVPNEDFSALCAGLVLQPVKKNTKLNIKEEVCDEKLFVLQNNSQTIQIEHSYHKRLSVESDDDEEPVKKRKRNEVDEDFSPYQKPKRKAGRPRTNFSKVDSQKTQRMKIQKTKSSKRTTQASKKLKSCSSVPFDRREQHNQAERERRDMLKKNLDIVEDITPDHVLHLTQIALQSEKTSKSDEFENNENNFTVDVLKKLDELIKKEPVSHRPKYKKASRNSKMVVLLGSTYYIGSLEKELKSKESRLAQLKKQYEECLKRLNPSRVSKKMRRN